MIQDFTKIEDKKEYDKVLYKILADFDTRISQFRQFVLDTDVALPFIMQSNSIIPKGYAQCNGINGTYKLTTLEQSIPDGGRLIYIQKVA